MLRGLRAAEAQVGDRCERDRSSSTGSPPRRPFKPDSVPSARRAPSTRDRATQASESDGILILELKKLEALHKKHNPGLMDSLRLNQVELKRIEAENMARDKKFGNVEKLIGNIQSKISMELDAKHIAEQEKRDADADAVRKEMRCQ
jgi:hypothetical protein